jgi:hypothetical protein
MDRQDAHLPWLVVLLTTALICFIAWWLPAGKPEAALGRYNYVQFMLALASTLVLVSMFCLALAGERKRRRRSFQIAAMWLGGLAALLTAETIARFLPARNNPFYLYNAGDTQDDSETGDRLPFTRPPYMKWSGWSRGNIADQLPDPNRRWLTFQTDGDGFRNSQDLTQADLVFIGDSFTEAGNVLEDESFVSRTAAALELKARNLGMAGYMPPAELVVLKRYGLTCRPRVVVWQIYEGNDLPESARYMDWRAAGFPPRSQQGTSRWEQWSITFALFRHLVPHKRDWFAGMFPLADGRPCEIRFGSTPSVDWIPVINDRQLEHPGWKPIVVALESGARRLRQLEIALVVVFVPTKITVMGDFTSFDDWSRERLPPRLRVPESLSMATQLQAVCERLDVVYVDTTDALRARAAAGELVYYPSDIHFSPHGHEVAGQEIVDAIRHIQ